MKIPNNSFLKKLQSLPILHVHFSHCCSADEAFDGSYPTNVVLTSEGGCTYIPPGIFKSTCKIDITWFPFDDQDCEMKFGSWTYDGGKARHLIINFVNMGRDEVHLMRATSISRAIGRGWDHKSPERTYTYYNSYTSRFLKH